jgi:hypothetical protein
MKLTPNFDTTEFDIHEPFPAHLAGNRQGLAIIAQWLRNIAGSPGRITSAYRSPARNAEVGGTETSQHQKGEAIDIVFPAASMRAMAEHALADIQSGRAPHFGQIIFYVDRGHIHLSLPRLGSRNGEVRFSFTDDGARLYPFLTDKTVAQLPGLTGAQAATAAKASGGLAALAVLAIGVVLASSCAAAQAQTQAVTTDSNVLITALSGVSAAFSMLVTYLAKETRNDVREMKPKVDVCCGTAVSVRNVRSNPLT